MSDLAATPPHAAPLTRERREKLREDAQFLLFCWPADTLQLLADLDAAEREVERLKHRRADMPGLWRCPVCDLPCCHEDERGGGA